MLVTNAAISRKSTVFTLMIVLVIFGMMSYIVLPRESTPDITIPYVLVVTPYEGVAPGDIETLITLPIERKLRGLKDVEEVRSTSAEGSSMITIEFTPDVDINDSLQRVRDKVDQAKGDLPDDLRDDPQILEINFSEFPIMMVAVSGDLPEEVLKEVGEELKDRMEGIPGVLEVVLTGGREREIRVEFDPDRLAAYGLSFAEILTAIQRENVNIPGGSIDIGKGKYLIRVPGEFDDPEEIYNIVLTVRDGKPIYIVDVASVHDTFEDRQSYARLNGQSSITLAIKKRAGENIIEVADRTFELLSHARNLVPEGVDLSVTMNQAKDIRSMVKELENNILSGLLLVVLVLFLFLGKMNSVFVALAIPFSMLISFIVLDLFGITLNMVVLFSLILSLGMLVDNAIVIVENIFRHMQMGKKRVQAARDAVAEVGWPVITSTVTTLCAFFPMMFWPGIMGEFMKYLPMTLIITLASSLFVALLINPVVCARFMRIREDQIVEESALRDRDLPYILDKYRNTLEWALTNTKKVLGIAFAGLFFLIVAYGFLGNGVELFPNTEPNVAYVEVRAPEGTNLDAVNDMVREVEAAVLAEPDVEYTIAEVGVAPSGEEGSQPQSHIGKVTMNFVDAEVRAENSNDIIERLREKLNYFPGADLKVEKQEEGPPTGPPVNIELSGEDPQVLGDIAAEARRLIRDVPGLVDLKDDFAKAKPEIRVQVDREKAAILGLSTADISNTIKAAVSGWRLGVYREGEDEYDIVARLPEERRESVADIRNLLIPSMTGDPVPLSTVAEITMGSGYGSIRRLDYNRVVTISANAEGRNSNEVLGDVMERLSGMTLPGGYTFNFSGELEEQQKAMSFLSKAFLVALFAITLVMITQFGSVRQSFIVMTSVFLSLTGVFFGLIVTHTPFSIIMTGVGVISLAGVVVNNAIVLIDYINQLRANDMELHDALIEAGLVRFRPVMLTAATTILGLLPMAVGVSIDFTGLSITVGGESAQWWGPMAVAVIFGLAVATMLTLVVVPVLYRLIGVRRPEED